MPTPILSVERYAGRIEEDSAQLAGLIGANDLERAVPTCPGWRLEDLIRHLGAVHRWARGYVVEGRETMIVEPSEREMLAAGPRSSELGTWLLEGASDLAAALRQAPPDLQCWSFLPAPSPRVFWARRQAHETAIHRVDAELVAGTVRPLPADFAADGINELLLGFAHRNRRRLSREEETAAVLVASDTGDRWRFAATPQGLEVAAEAELGAPTVVRGTAHQLYLLTWNRLPLEDVMVDGSPEPLRWLRSSLQVTWG